MTIHCPYCEKGEIIVLHEGNKIKCPICKGAGNIRLSLVEVIPFYLSRFSFWLYLTINRLRGHR